MKQGTENGGKFFLNVRPYSQRRELWQYSEFIERQPCGEFTQKCSDPFIGWVCLG
jgi:hypothetical protein